MKRNIVLPIVVALLAAPAVRCTVDAQPVTITVQADRPGAPVNPAMWGVFFEDINFGGDGGLAAELVKNRSFEFTEPLMGWTQIQKDGAKGSLKVEDKDPLNAANPHYLRAQVEEAGKGFGLSNEGFRAMGVRQGARYAFSVFCRSAAARPPSLRAELVAPDGRVLGSAVVSGLTPQWKRLTAMLRPSATEAKARLNVCVEGTGALDLDMVSLYPEDTWKKRPNGLRADLVQMLADLKPGFVRFPGGCIVEGRYLKTRYEWKTTIGKPEERRLIINRWNDEFKHRPAPDYFQSFGVGFFEFFLLCEDIGAEPLPILNCGMACQFNSGELVPLDQLDPFIQDALDLIEFATGLETTQWGRKRAEMGHPKPFKLRLLGVGNEQWGPQYIERYAKFAQVLKTKHPEIQLISSAGPSPADDRFHFLWPKLRELKADIVDEHCYDLPQWFFDNAGRYDSYDRHGPKVFMGEYAAQSVKVVSPDNRNNWECALAEAAYMTGLERNADVVVMASYAPLSAHIDAWQWTPNLIWFDNLRVYGTPNYYVQQMFTLHRGDVLLPVQVAGQQQPSSKQPGLYVTASRDRKLGEVVLKVVNNAAELRQARVQLGGTKKGASAGTAIVLTSARGSDENSLDEPRKVAPVKSELSRPGSDFAHTFPALSLTVLRLKTGD